MTVQRDHVEAELRRGCDDLRVIRSDPPKRSALARVDGAQRRAERSRVTPLHFDDHERRPVEANGIDLPAG